MPDEQTVNISLRAVDRSVLEDAAAMVPVIQRSPLAAVGPVSRSSVLRLALREGLKVLRRKYGAPEGLDGD